MIALSQTLHALGEIASAASPAPKPLDDDKVSPGWLGLAFLVAMALAVVFLVRSMMARLRNIDVDRHRREQEAKGKVPPAPRPEGADGPDGA